MAELASSKIVRARLHGMVRADPGVHLRRLAFLTGMSWNTCLHHLRRMERDGTVVCRKIQGKVCYFDKADGAVADKDALTLLREDRNQRIVRFIVDHPGTTQRAAAADLDLGTSALHRRVSRLEAAGVLARRAEGRCTYLFANDDIDTTLAAAGLAPVEDDLFGLPAPA